MNKIARPATLLGTLQKEIIKTARIIAAAVKVNQISETMPASLKSIDWLADPQKWLEEAKKNILKESGVKGKSGNIKSVGSRYDFEDYTLNFGKEFLSVSVRVRTDEDSIDPPMIFWTRWDNASYEAKTPQKAYKALVVLTQSIPLMVYAKEVLDLFAKTTGAVCKSSTNTSNDNTVIQVRMEMSLGGNQVGKLTSTLKTDTTPEWTLEWKGQEQTSKDLDVLLDMIDEEGDTMQPIFNNKTKLKKLVDDIASKLGVPVKKIDGTHIHFGGQVSGVKGYLSMHFQIIYDLASDMWVFAPGVLGFSIETSALEDPSRGVLAPWVAKATSVEEAKRMISTNFGKSIPGDLRPREVSVHHIANTYAITVDGGSLYKAPHVDDVIDHVREIIDFAKGVTG